MHYTNFKTKLGNEKRIRMKPRFTHTHPHARAHTHTRTLYDDKTAKLKSATKSIY